MTQPAAITIDGPAGAGKSTLGELLARRLGYLYFDTGVMYRALALAAHQQALDMHDEQALTALAHQVQIEVVPPTVADGRQYTVLVDAHDVTWAIREPDVTRSVSLVASYAGVRAELRRQQRAIGERGRVVMVGRDIGTHVMPDAPLKIYLRASLDERARRRLHEEAQRGKHTSLEEVRADLARRDAQDSHVLAPAADALLLDNDTLDPPATVARIVSRLQQADAPASLRDSLAGEVGG